MGRDRSRSLSSDSSGRGLQSSSWDGQAGYRLHIADLAVGISRKEVERIFSKYGPLNEVWVATNPPCFAFINFKHRSDAEKAVRDMDGRALGPNRVGVSWARTRRYGGRSGASRSDTYSSYRSSRDVRKRSRSRSRNDSHRPKRHRSRSRSRDREHRRHQSPRDYKRSDRRSTEKNNENNDEKKSRVSPSPARSLSEKQEENDTTEQILSHSSNSDRDQSNTPENNDQSPLTVGDE